MLCAAGAHYQTCTNVHVMSRGVFRLHTTQPEVNKPNIKVSIQYIGVCIMSSRSRFHRLSKTTYSSSGWTNTQMAMEGFKPILAMRSSHAALTHPVTQIATSLSSGLIYSRVRRWPRAGCIPTRTGRRVRRRLRIRRGLRVGRRLVRRHLVGARFVLFRLVRG